MLLLAVASVAHKASASRDSSVCLKVGAGGEKVPTLCQRSCSRDVCENTDTIILAFLAWSLGQVQRNVVLPGAETSSEKM